MFDLLHPSVQHHVVNSLGWSRLRPLQEAAIRPLLAGEDALLLAPTAGGKTEAALLPLLSRMAAEDWRGTSLLYVCPLRALLNNLQPRIASYAGWLGRTAAVRHGDTPQSERRRLQHEPPDVLLTTPESLEAMLVSSTLDHRRVLGDVRAVVIDEIHAFAGDDRGWHLLAVLERLARVTARPLQRVGLSATVGNPDELLTWLRGGNDRPGTVINPDTAKAVATDMALDYVGSLDNAATVIARLGVGEKRLVFVDSRRAVEQLGTRLTAHDVTTFVSHSSLSADERRRAESAFAEASDCVIVSTSTLELGIDVGDLDRVLQVGAPSSVASLLQRLGRTGRRQGSQRNMQVLAMDDLELLRAAGLLLLWSEGYVEPIVPPPTPYHLAAQQLLALALQEGRVGRRSWSRWLGALPFGTTDELREITDWLVDTGHLDSDQDMVFIGPEAERKFGRRHFMELMSVFTSAPQVTVFFGRNEIGTVDPVLLQTKVNGPRLLALAGRTWKVTSIEWSKKRAWVEPADGTGKARWIGRAPSLPLAVTDAMRRVLLGEDPAGVSISRRATTRLAELRDERAALVDSERSVVVREDNLVRWWTWAGGRANATLHAALDAVAPQVLHETATFDDYALVLRSQLGPEDLARALAAAASLMANGEVMPVIDDRALEPLKFSELLPPSLSGKPLAMRLSAPEDAVQVARTGTKWVSPLTP